MSKGTVNKVFIIGNLGHAPVVKRNEKCNYVQLSIATTQQWIDKSNNDHKERTEWHHVVIYGKLCDVVEKYVHKGDKLSIIGRLQTRKWAQEDGQEREKTEIIGEEMQILSGHKSHEEPF